MKGSPIDMFFAIGDKVTGGNPKRKADFDYYLMWVIFLAFFSVFLGNFINFIQYQNLASLGWSLFAIAIMWFQYHNLGQMRKARKLLKSGKQMQMKIESKEEMMEEFA